MAGPIQAGLLQGVQIQAPNLAALQTAYSQGIISGRELQDIFNNARSAQDVHAIRQEEIQNLPIRRAQEAEVSDQNVQFNNLKIEGAKKELELMNGGGSDLRPVLGPDGKPIPGFAKDRKGQMHTLPRTAAPTEAQSNAKMFASQMGHQRTILEEYESGAKKEAYDPTTKSQMPELNARNPLYSVARMATSADHNTYADAKNNWINAKLRKESGAAISASEYAGADKQYFPQMGDTPAQVEEKQKLRKLVEDEMHAAGESPQVKGFEEEKPPEEKTAKAPAKDEANLPVINSQAQYDALAPGTRYKDSHGQVAVKGGAKAPAAAPAAPVAAAAPKISPIPGLAGQPIKPAKTGFQGASSRFSLSY